MAEARTRTCAACGRSGTKAGLVRFVRLADGGVALDPSGRLPGRGAYLCPERACFEAARKRRALERALRISIDGEAYGRLEAEFGALCREHGAQ